LMSTGAAARGDHSTFGSPKEAGAAGRYPTQSAKQPPPSAAGDSNQK
jgi:hypothetical protein